MTWPKGPHYWIDGDTLHVSIPFTWNLPEVADRLFQRDFWWERAIVGGPAVKLIPDYFDEWSDFITVGNDCTGVLQRINPKATRTTTGCTNKCKFCAVPKLEGRFQELDDWPDLPIICDNNLLAASEPHLDRVFDRLEKHTGVDFNQGLDCRLLNDYHINRLKRLKRPKIRLACDSKSDVQIWATAVRKLKEAGIPKSWIHSYVLIGFDSGPGECWDRCLLVDRFSKAYPQWFHGLDCQSHNYVTPAQEALGWTNGSRMGIMRYFYKHCGKVREGV